MLNVLRTKRFWQLGALAGLDLIFFSLLNPVKVPSPLLVVGVMLLVLTFYQLIRLFWRFVAVYVPLGPKQQRQVSIIITAAFAAIVALESSGQLTTRDVITLSVLAFVGYLYLAYSRNSARSSG